MAPPSAAGKGSGPLQSPSGTLFLQVQFLPCQSQHTWKKTHVMGTLLILLLSLPRSSCPEKEPVGSVFLCSPCRLLCLLGCCCSCLTFSLPASLVLP